MEVKILYEWQGLEQIVHFMLYAKKFSLTHMQYSRQYRQRYSSVAESPTP